jgi:hypothetical protein
VLPLVLGRAESLTVPRSPKPVRQTDTPWLSIALSIAITLVVVTLARPTFRRLLIPAPSRRPCHDVAHTGAGARLAR